MKKNKLDIAKNLLSSGELVIFPTETVFGLGADATNDEAVKSIFKVKKRPRSNPIICHFKRKKIRFKILAWSFDNNIKKKEKF
jgi:L-threonylcarbamoyladenylate synthase